MNTGNIKKYAPKARTRLIETMTRQAARYGITKGHVAPAEVRGDVMLISALDGQTHSFPKALRGPREALAKWVTQLGFEQAMEQAAYSWFNRLCAIRFMELKGYLDHGRRVLSHPDHEGGFQILDDCLEIDLPGLDTARVRELKLDGTQDEALYRELLLAQCHALHEAMPFLFEPLDDASELLLPDNLTKTDSLIRELVEAIPEEDWQDVEVIGWLYQFYIAEKKDQVIGKVVKSEDIPAATQLFTPNWIVQYLVQNSVGRQWLQTYPDSPLKGEMPYYIEPAEQEPEVQAQLDAITPDSIDPETIKVLDPAMGSGHILVEAYNVLKAIYEERGYRSRDIPKLVLENNLFGLDIDDRAAQLAGFALLMKAREDDRRIFTRGVRLNVMALQSTQHLDASTLWRDLNLTGDWHQGQSQSLFEGEQKELSSNDSTYKAIVDLIERFQDAKTFGSLIEVPNSFEAPLKSLLEVLTELAETGDTMQKTAAKQLMPVLHQAWMLAQRYDALIANPPYMSNKGMVGELRRFAETFYPSSKMDLYSLFIKRSFGLLLSHGANAQIAMQSWLFVSSYEKFREEILSKSEVLSLLHVGYNSFPELNSKIVQCAAVVLLNGSIKGFCGKYLDLNSAPHSSNKNLVFFDSKLSSTHIKKQSLFLNIPGSPISYWVPDEIYKIFQSPDVASIKDLTISDGQNITANNEKYLRYFWEVSLDSIGRGEKWLPYAKGGDQRKWYGNLEYVVDWSKSARDSYKKNPSSRIIPERLWFEEGVTWTLFGAGSTSFRLLPSIATFDKTGSSVFFKDGKERSYIIALLNSKFSEYILKVLSSTLAFQVNEVQKIPCIGRCEDLIYEKGERLISLAKKDWDSCFFSIDFTAPPWAEIDLKKLSEVYNFYLCDSLDKVKKAKKDEEEINSLIIGLAGCNGKISPDVPLNEVSLWVNPYYRYGKSVSEEDSFKRYESDFVVDIIEYAVGCFFGRLSIYSEGFFLAHDDAEIIEKKKRKGLFDNHLFIKSGLIPVTDQEWLVDDLTVLISKFVEMKWGESNLQENLDFIAESLCLHAIKPKKGEAALETIRRYLSTQFYKDHLRTYKKRPIYWLFSSGKQKAFECLVYLHRYNESTLAEMRTDYVIPLTEKLASYVEKLEQDKEASASAAEAKRIEKELSKLYKQQAELNTFDEKLRHYADQRISLDLDDGVKVNYGKFGDLLAEVKAVTGDKVS
ncbi:BREX-1 system adenine-specific DNA-methyltransferase PglX [Halomonas halodenitrificans]|uniref:BREX-1 system adenine-specific DNA-methyltransferase PglX n=1 Tax=Halomonas halodenitrificans TaxID=28252 RepID=UPI000487D28A|nr:BREX-1 system adenine-specific DNA-methyltransferase PglX [Halomonas halodenitrificans]